MRVSVRDGTNQTPLGAGDLVGQVTVYAFLMRDGSLLSSENPEERPTDEDIAEMAARGGTFQEIRDNAKIVLDSGRTVYDCQVWWELAA